MCINNINTVNIVSKVSSDYPAIKNNLDKIQVENNVEISSDKMYINKKQNGRVPESDNIFQTKQDQPLPLKEAYPEGFGYGRPEYSYPFPDNYSPIYNDPFSSNRPEPSSPEEMRYAYRNALSRNNGYELLRLSKTENDRQLLPDVKAGDILYNSYQVGFMYKDPNLLLGVAKYEAKENLMTMKAGDILQDACDASRIRRDARSMMEIAKFENTENIMDAKAGDILYEAYTMAKSNRDVSTMLRIADYEGENDIMSISAEQIRSEAMSIPPHYGGGYPY